MREADMFDPFWCWLERTRRIRRDTLYARELHWVGRRIDLAILTASGALTAYEFKLNHNRRAIEQAAYNAHSFHRSYVVTATIRLLGLSSWRSLTELECSRSVPGR